MSPTRRRARSSHGAIPTTSAGRLRPPAVTANVAVPASGWRLTTWALVTIRQDAPDRAPRPAAAAAAPSGEGLSDTEAAVEQTVDAYAAAEGEEAVCATLVAERRDTCATAYSAAQPTAYDVERIEVADDEAVAKVTQATYGDPIEFELLREGGRWLIAGADGFECKDAEEVEAVTAVARFARGDEEACRYLSRETADQCEGLRPHEPIAYDYGLVSTAYGTGSVQAELSAGESDYYDLVEEAGRWRIESIND